MSQYMVPYIWLPRVGKTRDGKVEQRSPRASVGEKEENMEKMIQWILGFFWKC